MQEHELINYYSLLEKKPFKNYKWLSPLRVTPSVINEIHNRVTRLNTHIFSSYRWLNLSIKDSVKEGYKWTGLKVSC